MGNSIFGVPTKWTDKTEGIITVEETLADVARLDRDLKMAWNIVSTALDMAAEEAQSEAERNAAIRFFYWEHFEIPSSMITDAFNITKYQLRNIVPGWTVIYACIACLEQYGEGAHERDGSLIRINLTSRSDSTAIDNLYKHGRGFTGDRARLMCEPHKNGTLAAVKASREELDRMATERTARLIELKTMPYREYLQSPEWQAKRQSAIRAANGRCALCNERAPLDVHHRTYERRGEEYHRDLIALCRNCHAKFHDKLPQEPAL